MCSVLDKMQIIANWLQNYTSKVRLNIFKCSETFLWPSFLCLRYKAESIFKLTEPFIRPYNKMKFMLDIQTLLALHTRPIFSSFLNKVFRLRIWRWHKIWRKERCEQTAAWRVQPWLRWGRLVRLVGEQRVLQTRIQDGDHQVSEVNKLGDYFRGSP